MQSEIPSMFSLYWFKTPHLPLLVWRQGISETGAHLPMAGLCRHLTTGELTSEEAGAWVLTTFSFPSYTIGSSLSQVFPYKMSWEIHGKFLWSRTGFPQTQKNNCVPFKANSPQSSPSTVRRKGYTSGQNFERRASCWVFSWSHYSYFQKILEAQCLFWKL